MSRAPDLARRELWRRRMREFERSAATVADFCDRAGVSAAAFYQWRRKLSDVSSSEGLTKPGLVSFLTSIQMRNVILDVPKAFW
jgi:transposase-like protein